MQLIQYTDYKQFCDNEYVSFMDIIPEGNTIFVHLDHIYKFLKLAAKTDRKLTVVSASSDYGIHHQSVSPVYTDMEKWLKYFTAIDNTLAYNPVLIPPRCDTTKCRIDDEYSVKMHSWTLSTFDSIPESIQRWFVVNANVYDKRIHYIPFGIPQWTHDLIQAGRSQGRHLRQERGKFMTFACSINSCIRLELSRSIKKYPNIYCPKNTLSHSDYVNTLFDSEYVICPEGNGLDSYRILEAIYCGATPIVLGEQFTNVYEDRVIRLNNWYELFDFGKLKRIAMSSLDNTSVDLNYWRHKINGILA